MKPLTARTILSALVLVLLVAPCAMAGEPGEVKYELRVSYGPVVGLHAPAMAASNTVYTGGDDGKVYAVSPDGTLKWVFDAGSPVTTSAAVYYSPDGANVQYNGRVYVGLEDGRVLCIGSAGILRWEFDAGSPVTAPPALAADGTIYVGTETTMLIAINPDGTFKWQSRLGIEGGMHGPVVAPDGTIVCGLESSQSIWAVNPDGTFKWGRSVLGGVHTAAAIARDGSIYFGGVWRLHALWPDGQTRWELYLGEGATVRQPPVIGDQGTIYVAAERLFAVNPDGTPRWTFMNDEGAFPEVYAAAAVDSAGMIYAAAHDGSIYCVEPGGAQVWRTDTGSQHLQSPVIGSDGLVYFVDYYKVRAIYTGAIGPFDSAWPMYRCTWACSARLDKYWYMMIDIKQLLTYVRASNLQKGTKRSLVAKLEPALDAIERGRINVALNKTRAFINEVKAQSGKKINPEIAGVLLQEARQILVTYGAMSPDQGAVSKPAATKRTPRKRR
ncbi:MAG: PQQ-like beta-propeller repeat protein [Verrucomicrobia bacterium]|nr:PQQ-like beta-propeller repeat protein [Verrucomicrobiota bacterium]